MLEFFLELGRIHGQPGHSAPLRIVQFQRPVLDAVGQAEAGLALENFDVMGGWRDRYRAEGESVPEPGLGKGGQKFAFHYALPVDASGQLPDGRKFRDIREFKQLLLADEEQLARNLTQQLIVYATGAPIRFSDRPAVAKILANSRAGGYGVRKLVHETVQSELFLNK